MIGRLQYIALALAVLAAAAGPARAEVEELPLMVLPEAPVVTDSLPGHYGVQMERVVRVGPEGWRISALHPEGSAARAGLRVGDRVLAVGGVSLTGRSYDERRRMLAGEAGVVRQLTILRAGEPGPREVRVPLYHLRFWQRTGWRSAGADTLDTDEPDEPDELP